MPEWYMNGFLLFVACLDKSLMSGQEFFNENLFLIWVMFSMKSPPQ